MPQIVLLAVAAAWAAVLIPPLMRSRNENRPNSSVTDFRRQLSTLQRSVPTRTMVPARAMGRPLTQSAPVRQHATPGQAQRGSLHTLDRRPAHDGGQHGHHSQVHVHRVSQREITRRRRTNVLFVLGVTVATTLFLAATTKSNAMVYMFALSFVALCGYCYKLVQIRNEELDRQYSDHAWFHAA